MIDGFTKGKKASAMRGNRRSCRDKTLECDGKTAWTGWSVQGGCNKKAERVGTIVQNITCLVGAKEASEGHCAFQCDQGVGLQASFGAEDRQCRTKWEDGVILRWIQWVRAYRQGCSSGREDGRETCYVSERSAIIVLDKPRAPCYPRDHREINHSERLRGWVPPFGC